MKLQSGGLLTTFICSRIQANRLPRVNCDVPSDSIKYGQYFNQPNDCQLIQEPAEFSCYYSTSRHEVLNFSHTIEVQNRDSNTGL
jgi:hypothetical protein